MNDFDQVHQIDFQNLLPVHCQLVVGQRVLVGLLDQLASLGAAGIHFGQAPAHDNFHDGGRFVLFGLHCASKPQHQRVVLACAPLAHQALDPACAFQLGFHLFLAHVQIDGAVHAAAPVFLHLAGEGGQGHFGHFAHVVGAIHKGGEVGKFAWQSHGGVLLKLGGYWPVATRSAKSA